MSKPVPAPSTAVRAARPRIQPYVGMPVYDTMCQNWYKVLRVAGDGKEGESDVCALALDEMGTPTIWRRLPKSELVLFPGEPYCPPLPKELCRDWKVGDWFWWNVIYRWKLLRVRSITSIGDLRADDIEGKQTDGHYNPGYVLYVPPEWDVRCMTPKEFLGEQDDLPDPKLKVPDMKAAQDALLKRWDEECAKRVYGSLRVPSQYINPQKPAIDPALIKVGAIFRHTSWQCNYQIVKLREVPTPGGEETLAELLKLGELLTGDAKDRIERYVDELGRAPLAYLGTDEPGAPHNAEIAERHLHEKDSGFPIGLTPPERAKLYIQWLAEHHKKIDEQEAPAPAPTPAPGPILKPNPCRHVNLHFSRVTGLVYCSDKICEAQFKAHDGVYHDGEMVKLFKKEQTKLIRGPDHLSQLGGSCESRYVPHNPLCDKDYFIAVPVSTLIIGKRPFLLYLEPVNEDAQPPPGGWGWTRPKC